jgi:L-malate glycosyltransferase
MKLIFLGNAIAEHLLRWARSFTGLGHEVHVVTWNTVALDGYEPAVVHRLSKPLGDTGVIARAVNLWRLRADVRRLIGKIQPDLVHAQTAGSYAWVAMFSGFHPYLITPTGDDVLIDVHCRAIERFFTARSLRRADWLHCEGFNTKEAMIRLGADPKRILVMPLGVNLERFVPGDPPREFLEKHGLMGARVVVSTRTLVPVHDIETTIRAAALVLRNAPDVKFLMVGGGDSGSFRELAKTLGIAPSFIFTGHVDEREMVACLQAADVYVSTTLSESGTAVSMAEAMACGLPIVNTDTGDIRMWVRDGEGGYVVPVKSPNAVAERILHLLDHPAERQCAGQVNRRAMEERYDVRKVTREMEALYSRLIAQFNARGSF